MRVHCALATHDMLPGCSRLLLRWSQIKRMLLSAGQHHTPEVVLQEIDDYPIRDVVVDSQAGYLYWHTDRSLEYARLDGQHPHNIHHESEIYSGALPNVLQVLGYVRRSLRPVVGARR